MKYEDFKHHKIHKRKGLSFDDPHKYAKYLSEDFSGRCCYCNMSEDSITASFHVEHFIPVKVFEGKKDNLLTDYENLMWACPKCNLSKSSKYAGDLMKSNNIENKLFYNPVETDYNDIFYRNEIGAIDSDDQKGREMIKELKLYRPVHTLSWLVEKLETTHELLEKAVCSETDPDRKREQECAKNRIANIYIKKQKVFRAAYKNKFGNSVNI